MRGPAFTRLIAILVSSFERRRTLARSERAGSKYFPAVFPSPRLELALEDRRDLHCDLVRRPQYELGFTIHIGLADTGDTGVGGHDDALAAYFPFRHFYSRRRITNDDLAIWRSVTLCQCHGRHFAIS